MGRIAFDVYLRMFHVRNPLRNNYDGDLEDAPEAKQTVLAKHSDVPDQQDGKHYGHQNEHPLGNLQLIPQLAEEIVHQVRR